MGILKIIYFIDLFCLLENKKKNKKLIICSQKLHKLMLALSEEEHISMSFCVVKECAWENVFRRVCTEG